MASPVTDNAATIGAIREAAGHAAYRWLWHRILPIPACVPAAVGVGALAVLGGSSPAAAKLLVRGVCGLVVCRQSFLIKRDTYLYHRSTSATTAPLDGQHLPDAAPLDGQHLPDAARIRAMTTHDQLLTMWKRYAHHRGNEFDRWCVGLWGLRGFVPSEAPRIRHW